MANTSLDSDRSRSPVLVVDIEEPTSNTQTDQNSSKSSYNHTKISPPITLLQEICSRNGFTPEYQLLSTEGSVHEPTFKIAVTVDDITVTASGQSKKKARHAAAREAIEKLRLKKSLNLNGINFEAMMMIDGIKSSIASTNSGAMNDSSSDDPPKSSYAIANSDANPVGKLQEICMKMRVNPPDYDTCQEKGLAHERIFILSCKIASLNMTTIGEGRSKKLAKRQAAELMLTQLENSEIYDKSTSNSKTQTKSNNADAQVSSSSINIDLDDPTYFVKSRRMVTELCNYIDCNVEYLREEIAMIDADRREEDLYYKLFQATFLKEDEVGGGIYKCDIEFISDIHCLLVISHRADEYRIMSTFGAGTDNVSALKDAVKRVYMYCMTFLDPLTEKDPHLRHREVEN